MTVSINQIIYKTSNCRDFSQLKTLCKNVHIPQSAAVYDFVQISRKDGAKIDVLTLKDKLGKVIKKYIVEKTNDTENVIEKFYKKLKESFVSSPDCLSERLSVTGRKISTVKKSNGIYTGKSEEIQTITHTNKGNILHISKVESSPIRVSNKNFSDETLSLYEYSKFRPKKGYKINNYIRYRNGEHHREINPDFQFEGFSEFAPIAFKIDRYFPLHLYSLKQFKKNAPYTASHPSHKMFVPGKIKWYNEYGSTISGKCLNESDVYLNNRVIDNRLDVINNAAHEKEHAYQHEQAMWIDMKERREARAGNFEYDMYIDDIDKAKQYRFNFEHYTKPEEDISEYKKQVVERDANKAGYIAEKRYKQSSQNLKKEFPFAPDYLIGYSQEDKMKSDSLRGGLMSFEDFIDLN